jgi:hypothetical protein
MKRLIEIQKKLKAPKNQYNSFGKYKYRSCEDILEGVKPLLAELNVALVVSDEICLIGDRYYVKATVNLLDEENKLIFGVSAYAREEETKKGMDGSQVTGAASSYARKYALNGLFAIDDTKDADATNTHDKEPKKEKLNDSQIYISLAKLTDLEQIKNYYENNKDKVNDPENLRTKAREQYKAISNAKKIFEGVENG